MNFQQRSWEWFIKCFHGDMMAGTRLERCARVTEEFAETMQSCEFPLEKVLQGIRDVYNRDHVGELEQEIGGLYLTLATLCTALNINGEACADLELSRVNNKIPEIREKSRMRREAEETNLEKVRKQLQVAWTTWGIVEAQRDAANALLQEIITQNFYAVPLDWRTRIAKHLEDQTGMPWT
jgi:hypothetical protein